MDTYIIKLHRSDQVIAYWVGWNPHPVPPVMLQQPPLPPPPQFQLQPGQVLVPVSNGMVVLLQMPIIHSIFVLPPGAPLPQPPQFQLQPGQILVPVSNNILVLLQVAVVLAVFMPLALAVQGPPGNSRRGAG